MHFHPDKFIVKQNTRSKRPPTHSNMDRARTTGRWPGTSNSSRMNPGTRKLQKGQEYIRTRQGVMIAQRTISNLTLFIPRYTFPPISRISLRYALPPKKPIKLLFKSVMPSESMEESEVRPYVSEQPPSISSSQQSNVFADLARHYSCIFSDVEHRPYPKYRHYQRPDSDRGDVSPAIVGHPSTPVLRGRNFEDADGGFGRPRLYRVEPRRLVE